MIVDWKKETVRREGYFQALLDVKNWFERHSVILKNNRMYSKNGISLILSAMADNVDFMSVVGEDMELYYDKERNKIGLIRN